jgi:hypothetical protein
MPGTDMWPSSDRRVLEVIKRVDRKLDDDKREKVENRSEGHFKKTLDKLWPLKSNEKPS